MYRPGVPRPFGGAAAPRRSGVSSFGGMSCLVILVATMGLIWYSVTVAILTGCDKRGADVEEREDKSLVKIGAVAMSGLRKLTGREHNSGEQKDVEEPVVNEPAHLKPETLANPKVAALTKRLLGVLRKEQGGAQADDAFASVAASLAQAVIAAEEGGVVVTDEDEEGDSKKEPETKAKASDESNGDDDAPAPEYTQQTCYLQTDESEICVYDGVLCYDGRSPVVAVEEPIRAPERILDYTHYCSDFRWVCIGRLQ